MPDPQDDFRDLRRLLALKRYEQPPPGYFQRLPEQILDTIQARRRPKWWGWLNRLVPRGGFELRPALAGTLVLALGVFYAFGLHPTADEESANLTVANPNPVASLVAPPTNQNQSGVRVGFVTFIPISPTGHLDFTTDKVMQQAPPPGLFAPGAPLIWGGVRVQPAGFIFEATKP